MTAAFNFADHPLVRHLSAVAELSSEAKKALAELPMQVQDIKADQDLVREGDRPSRSCLILEGFAVSSKTTGEGKRQILAYHMLGDIPDVQSLHLTVIDNTLATVTPAKVGFIQHEILGALCARHVDIANALWRGTLISAAIYREWMTNVGRREAKSRLAHFLCETLVRMKAVGLTTDHACELALTQNELADTTGMSTVHVNRVLQELRTEGLVSLKGSALRALDWEGLKRAGDFDPTYLHFRDPTLAA